MAKSVLDVEEARLRTAEGLKLCLAGDEAGGIARYHGCLLPEVAGKLGLMVHLRMMEGAGRTLAADQLRTMMLRKGNDITYASVAPNASPEDAVAEYEDRFARGMGNAVMIEAYLRALGRLGRTDRVAAMFDTARLLHRTRIGDHEAVARAMLEAEPDFTYGSETITRQMRYRHRIERLGNPVYDALLAEIRAEIAAHCARWAASGHPLARLVPDAVEMKSWAMIARAEGHNVRHVHPYGWVTAIYYPAGLPEGSMGGQLRVGGWQDPPPPGWPDVSITPEPGLLVILPSWYVHWTEPTRAAGARLAITTEAVAA
ncbi:2OG-Fe(II) oxygenase family protein [Sphingomonas sp. LB-2]|uniref:2OG-Fe(II) oxygenase family protein n=1 Tax=Sphingomonas caeni TaxID=2984949 RepID=UPI00222E218B|nr:2OG-Fe(II) oxygenase family protein [Sphingomonas caeni]MCW3847334.1 2OG-Fe(II) oxygenase family protein [Sphingomonas caeni]